MPLDHQKANTGRDIKRDHGGVVLMAENQVCDWLVITAL